MNSHKKTIVVLLFMMACGVLSARADERPCDEIHIKHMRGDKRICQACRDLQDNLSGSEQAQIELQKGNAGREAECGCELLEEIENSAACRRESRDQQTDALEKLLLETTAPGVNPPGP